MIDGVLSFGGVADMGIKVILIFRMWYKIIFKKGVLKILSRENFGNHVFKKWTINKQNCLVEIIKKQQGKLWRFNQTTKKWGKKMWITKTEKGYYTIYYCPMCKKQRTYYSINKNLWKCSTCNLIMKYNYKTKKLHI